MDSVDVIEGHLPNCRQKVPSKDSVVDGKSNDLSHVLSKYIHDDAVYAKVRELLNCEMEIGLARSTNANATVKMFITYVQSLPNGTECGDYLALDLGGTNFRVLLISLKGASVEMKNKIYSIADELMVGPGYKLFDHIADCIANFMADHELNGKQIPLGFTFSFPCHQEGLAVGRLARWTKGFNCDGVVGEDVVTLLQQAIKRRGDINVECVAILNDTVGCLMSCAFTDHSTEVGVILGTGTNACYMEKLQRVELWDGINSEPDQVIINTEWGAFGDNGCLDFVRTDIDKDVDRTSLNPNKQTFEKMISGMYMGEIVRRLIVECASKGLIFNGHIPADLNTEGRFYTKYVSEIEQDEDDGEFSRTQQILDELGVIKPTLIIDCQRVQEICRVISERAAFLASAGIAALINRINKPNATVAVDGSLYRFHPHFHNLMLQKTQSLIKEGLKLHMMLSEDGSGKGAALVAAVAHRIKTTSLAHSS